MKKEKVTRNDLRSMKVGQTEVFSLPEKGKIESAKATCQQLRLEKMRFKTAVKPEEMAIVITRTM